MIVKIDNYIFLSVNQIYKEAKPFILDIRVLSTVLWCWYSASRSSPSRIHVAQPKKKLPSELYSSKSRSVWWGVCLCYVFERKTYSKLNIENNEILLSYSNTCIHRCCFVNLCKFWPDIKMQIFFFVLLSVVVLIE